MEQIIKWFQQSNARMDMMLKGNYNREAMDQMQREAEAQLKAMNVVISGFAVESKNKRAAKALEKMNLMGNLTAIDTGHTFEDDKVKCLAKDDALITRAQCLDYSGEADHQFVCRKCEAGLATKRLLLTPKG